MIGRRNKILFNLVLQLLPVFSLNAANDSLSILTVNGLLGIVREYHPVVKQADLLVKRAGAQVQQARGAFDPAVGSGLDRKTFNGDLYYSYFNSQLTIPTWYGVDIKAGLEEIVGDRVTTQATLGQTSFAGLNFSANELIFDRRRAVLQQARSFRSLSEAERDLAINNIIADALYAYWEWQKNYQYYLILKDIIQVNEERLRFVRIEFEQGNRPAIDTTEVLAQLQTFRQQQSQAYVSFQNAGLSLSNFLWLDKVKPFYWDAKILPDTSILNLQYSSAMIEELITSVQTDINTHPKLQSLRYKIDMLETERKLKFQGLLPKVNIQANLLNKGYDLPGEVSRTMLENNYKLGLTFKMPLLLREARGAYRAADFKVQEAKMEQDLTELQVQNKIKEYFNQVNNLREQIRIFEDAYQNSVRLYQGEKLRFEVGESTLFLVNSRENKMLEMQQKLISLKTEWQKSFAGLVAAAGRFGREEIR